MKEGSKMETYIALLRGVNVGGKNKISMAQLKTAFQNYGYTRVKTYINSGNVIFSTDKKENIVLQEECKMIIKDTFELDIDLLVISANHLLEVLEHKPDWWGKEDDSKHNAIFVIYPYTAEEIIQNVGEIKPEYEKVDCYGQVIFWSAPLETFSRTRWSKVVSSSLYDKVTIRNFNTFQKLVNMVDES